MRPDLGIAKMDLSLLDSLAFSKLQVLLFIALKLIDAFSTQMFTANSCKQDLPQDQI